MKLKYKEVKLYREQQLALQNNLCALCGDAVTDDAVLDHDHKTGLLRQVLHRGCNSLLGKIENNLARSQMDHSRLRSWAENLVDYIQTTHTGILHPTYKTREERAMYKKKKKPVKPGKGRY